MSAPVHIYRIDVENSMPPAVENRLADSKLPGKPSIAVLPFDNMSGDPDQEYFADGITENVITELSRFQSLSVIARNSTFTYKGRPVRVQSVARDLGVRYVVEGSVRKSGERVRVTVQLVEATTGNHLWAEKYDRNLTDIFELQDEITQSIVATVSGRLEIAAVELLKSKPPADLNAYDCLMRAKLCHHRGGEKDNAEAMRLLDTAIDLEPGYAAAYGWKVCVIGQAWARGYREFSTDDYNSAVEIIRRGIAEDENDIECVRILCEYGMEDKKFDDAERYNEKALRLNPNDPRIVAQRGELLTWLSKPDEGVEWVRRAIQLDPFSEDDWAHLLGCALFGARRYDEAIQAYKRVPQPKYGHCAYMAACYAWLTQTQNAAALAAEVLDKKSDFSAADFVNSLLYQFETDRQHLLKGLTMAGLPE